MPWLVLRLLALKSWLSSRTRNLTSKPVRVGIFAFVGAILFYPASAHAAPLWVDQLAQGFAYYAYAIASAITQIIVLLIDAMVPIMTYNNFVGNPVVKAGWAIVRDTVNMFFVVILIIIAFGTIFGNERFKWQQQVPRLLTMAIVVNFSKTLCGIMIDFGQVIMLTFANALREIAAGNFIQLLGLNQIYSVSTASSMVKGVEDLSGEGVSQAFDFFAAGLASVLMVMWVLATLVIMVAILLFRIVMLWVLVVIAPLAWFMKGADGIIKSNAYSEWWSEFKCLVGIGPILAFFLWLTLAVAGAGNIAANSGFDVNADSNNAGFTSSLLEVNNFLSFLIGMAMLFAGFKAAAEFCSGGISGGIIGKQLGAAKAFSPEKVARFAAGQGLKLGGYGARLGGRVVAGTPAAAAAAARYIPPSLNIPARAGRYVTQKRADIAGAVGRVLPGGLGGRYLQGKQADIELGMRANKFVGVTKEKEAMKDKSRDWKKGQIESMLNSPPVTQAGQDKMSALFEEAMADSRLQKELGPDGVRKLWESQGKKYEDMSKGNAAKTADLEGFKKKYAHVTGAVDELENVDDMKGLAAGAWGDAAVQEKAGRMQTIIGGKKMTALEAAREGHYGENAQKAAVKGTDVTKLNRGLLMNQFQMAVRTDDKASADKALTQIEAKYIDPNTSQEERASLAREMDFQRAQAHSMGRNDIVASFDTKRKSMETKSGFGLPPAPKQGDDIDRYVESNFGQSSGERIDDAVRQIDQEKTEVEKEKGELEKKLGELKGVEKTIADKQKQIADVRRSIEQSVGQERKQAHVPVARAQKNLASAEKRGAKGDELARYQKAVADAQTEFDAEVRRGNAQVAANPTINSLEREVQKTIDDAGGDVALKQAQEKTRRLNQLEDQAKRLKETKDRLEQERKKRTT